MWPIVALICAALTGACCITLIFHKDYDDGIIGRIALGLMGFAAFARVTTPFFGLVPIMPTPVSVFLWSGIALFMTRHTMKFLIRSKKRDSTWYAQKSK